MTQEEKASQIIVYAQIIGFVLLSSAIFLVYHFRSNIDL